MINDYHHGKGVGHSKSFTIVMYVMLACNDCDGSTIVHIIIMNRKVQPNSNGLRIHVLHIMKTKTAS